MKFFRIEFTVNVVDGVHEKPLTVSLPMTMGDEATMRDAADRFVSLLETKLETVDIGDCE